MVHKNIKNSKEQFEQINIKIFKILKYKLIYTNKKIFHVVFPRK